MKKSLIALGVVVLVALALPIIGNSVMQNSINEKVAELQSYGVESQKTDSQSSYLSTKVHFEFLLKDADTFIEYLNRYADNQIPPYVNAVFAGVVVGVDLEYSNFLLSKSLSVDIYPMQLSTSMQKSLQSENPDFFAYFDKFLESKGILYHINYNIATKKFDGYVKDIDENQTLDAQTQLQVHLQEAKFEGEGELLAPQKLSTSLHKLELGLQKENEHFLVAINELTSKNLYLSKLAYNSHIDIKELNFLVSTHDENIKFKLAKAAFKAASTEDANNVAIVSNTSVEELFLSSRELNIELKESKIDFGLYELEKVSYEGFFEIISKMNKTDAMMDPLLIEEMQESLSKLLSKGFVFKVTDFSVQKILLDKSKNLEGFHVQAQVRLKADSDFAQKLQLSPLLLASNIEANTVIKISKKLYEFSLNGAARAMSDAYLKEDKESYIFDISYKDGQIKINDKLLQ